MFNYNRRKTNAVRVGNTMIGGNTPIRVQTMANTDTNNIEASLAQARRCVANGAELIRYTTQGTKEVENLAIIRQQLRAEGIDIPIVADIHFNPKVAEAAAAQVEKIRINPGNFVAGKTQYTDEEWSAELTLIKEKLHPIIEICHKHNTAIRIGVNLGSLSPRIMSRYGNTPKGLVASCIEFLELCQSENFHNIVLSVKASNTISMIHAVRLLTAEMEKRGMRYPLHLGVTEAGSDDEGRIKSAIGIGTLLGEGIGDTIRVSLSELPEAEIPVAQKIVDYITNRNHTTPIEGSPAPYFSRYEFRRRNSCAVDRAGNNQPVIVVADKLPSKGLQPDYTIDTLPAYITVDANDLTDSTIASLKDTYNKIILINTSHDNRPSSLAAAIHRITSAGVTLPVMASVDYSLSDIETLQIHAACDLGPLLIDGLIDGIYISNNNPAITTEQITSLAFNILQSSRARITQTEYISCPSCGRTKFDLPRVVQQVKQATSKYVGLKIAVMGCIVNGPGEMADADFGYIGAGQDKVSLFKGKECIKKNIPAETAIAELIELIEQHI